MPSYQSNQTYLTNGDQLDEMEPIEEENNYVSSQITPQQTPSNSVANIPAQRR